MRRSIAPGIILILMGGLLLLDKLGYYRLRWSTIYPLILLLLGVMFFSWVWRRGDKGAVFPGTILFLLGLFFFFRNSGLLPLYYLWEFWPVFLIIVGLAFVVLFIFKPHDWGVLVPGGILLFFGTVFLLNNIYYLPWRTRELVGTFWPVILIIIGIGIILGQFKKRPE